MENLENTDEPKRRIEIDDSTLGQLSEIQKWTKILSVIGFVTLSIFLVIGVIALVYSFFESQHHSIYTVIPIFILCVLYYFPVHYLYKFSKYSKITVSECNDSDFAQAVKYLKLHFRFICVMVIVVLCIYLLLGLIMVVASRFPGVIRYN